MYRRNYEQARFHVEFGPDSLFERVRYRMKDVHTLFQGKHFLDRAAERNVPVQVLEALAHFDASTWRLKTAEVRTDRGKFVCSGWEMEAEGRTWFVTIGVGNYLRTVFPGRTPPNVQYVRSGALYDLTEQVNRRLMEESRAEEARDCRMPDLRAGEGRPEACEELRKETGTEPGRP